MDGAQTYPGVDQQCRIYGNGRTFYGLHRIPGHPRSGLEMGQLTRFNAGIPVFLSEFGMARSY
jgi:hypothetical protein